VFPSNHEHILISEQQAIDVEKTKLDNNKIYEKPRFLPSPCRNTDYYQVDEFEANARNVLLGIF
jgi:hypothetical protein